MTKRPTLRHRRGMRPPPASQASYLAHAEACLAAAAGAGDASSRHLYEEECKLWLMLARQRQAIEGVLQRYFDEADAAA